MAFAVESQGQEYPVEYDDMVQANAGLGYGVPYNPNAIPLAPYGMSGSPDGIGAYARPLAPKKRGVFGHLTGSPLLRGIQAVRGLGDDAAVTPGSATAAAPIVASGILVAAVAVGLALTAAGGYYVGKAVAPSSSSENKYAWWGVAAALLGGPIGLGVEAIIALEHKGR